MAYTLDFTVSYTTFIDVGEVLFIGKISILRCTYVLQLFSLSQSDPSLFSDNPAASHPSHRIEQCCHTSGRYVDDTGLRRVSSYLLEDHHLEPL